MDRFEIRLGEEGYPESVAELPDPRASYTGGATLGALDAGAIHHRVASRSPTVSRSRSSPGA